MAAGQNNDDAYMIANAAMARMEAHEELCLWRYQQIVANQNVATADRVKMHTENKESLALMGARIDRMYGRSWTITLTVMGLLGAGLLYFIKAYLEAHP